MIVELLTLALILYVFYEFYWKRKDLPPGPTPLPIIGNLHIMLRHEPGYSAYEMWRKQFGPVYTYWIGSYPFIMISDYKTIKDTFIKEGDAYAGKFCFIEITNAYRGGKYGILDTSGEVWQDHRRFAIHVLKDLGLGKRGMEQRILHEVEAMIEILRAAKSEEIEIQDVFDVRVGSVVNQLLFGYGFDEDNLGEFRQLKGMISKQMKEFSHPLAVVLLMYPWLKAFPYFKTLWNKLILYRDSLAAFLDRQIEAHDKDIDYDAVDSNDYVEAFLKEKKRRESLGDTVSFSYIQLRNMCFDMWIAGMETTSNTLSWGVVYVLNHLQVQAKIHEELDRQVGSKRIITTSDKNNLPYTNAVINEIQRLANLLPMNLPHETLREVEIEKWKIPAHTGIIAQISNVLYDNEVFPSPLTFDPSRFIDDNGKLKKIEELIPFSIGKRQCLGEGLARMELFLFISNLFNQFELCCVDDNNPPSMKKSFGTTVQPGPYRCLVKPRFS